MFSTSQRIAGHLWSVLVVGAVLSGIAQGKRPNVVLILIDDLNHAYSCQPDAYLRTYWHPGFY